MNLDYILEFTMLVKHGNLSEAARELYTTQSALSRHLSLMEKDLGATLFDRSTSPMKLTPIGEVFLQDCQSLVNDYVRIRDKIRRLKESDFQNLLVAGIIDPAISTILRKVKQRVEVAVHPASQVIIKLFTDTLQTSLEAVRRGEADLAIEPMSRLIDIHELQSVALLSEPCVIVAETCSPFADLEVFNDNAFSKASFTSLRSNKDHATRKHLQDMAHQRGFLGDLPGGLLLSPVDSYQELFLMGLNGALVMLPESMALEFCPPSHEEYVVIPFPGEENNYNIRAFYSANPTPKVQAFLDALATEE